MACCGCVGCFLCACMCHCLLRVQAGLGIRVSLMAVGFTFNTVLASAPVGGGRLRIWPLSFEWRRCGGLLAFPGQVSYGYLFCTAFVFCLVSLGIRWMPASRAGYDVAPAICPRGVGERALLSEGCRMGEPNLGCVGHHHLDVVVGNAGSETS